MELVIAENHQFSSSLCTDCCDEQLSNRSSDAMLCGISVHRSSHSLSADVGTAEKYEECVTDTAQNCRAHSAAVERSLSVVSGDSIPCVLPAESCTDASCVTEDSESASSYNHDLPSVTAKLDISAAHSTDIAEPQYMSQSKSLCSTKKSVCFPADETGSSADAADDGSCVLQQESKNMSLLLRLFESRLFDMAIALPYLFNSKEPGVLAYLGW